MKWTLLLSRLACLLYLAIMLAQSPAWALDTDVAPELDAVPPNSKLNPGYVRLTRNEIDALILARPDRLLNLPTLERFTGNEPDKLPFARTELFASGVRIRTLGDEGARELPVDSRQIFLASNQTTAVGLAVNALTGDVRGFVSRGPDKFEIKGNFLDGLNITSISEPDGADNSCTTALSGQPDDVRTRVTADSMFSASAAEVGSVLSYEAVVAIDTDSEWLDGFNDDEGRALTWITDLFLAMNVFYERDLETRLLIGDVTLRTGSDPYSVPSNRSDQLDEFGAYWKDNMGQVERQFAAMFSGRNISSYSFSGIAWIGQFCEYGRTWGSRTVGSFSYNAIGSNRTPGNTAIYVGHELGHNMGSPHTHCYSPPVDGCYNAGGSGCYSGNPVCPAGGRGTIMSYCHVGGNNGAGCGTSNSEFHPTVQALIENNLADELVAGCILPYVAQAPEPEFQSTPAPDTSLQFGAHEIGGGSGQQYVLVENIGDAALSLDCSISGADSSSFGIEACPAAISAASSADIIVQCAPQVTGILSATLELSMNDVDEADASYPLACEGVPLPLGEIILRQGFEGN